LKDKEGILVNGDDGRGVDLLSEAQHGDCQLRIEFNVTKGSNSGVYFQGQYEVQILDSFGKADKDLNYGDCGGIYHTAKPRLNASRRPANGNPSMSRFKPRASTTRARRPPTHAS